MKRVNRCRKKLVSGRRCSLCARMGDFCTVHYIKSGYYKGKNKNIRRKKVVRRRR